MNNGCRMQQFVEQMTWSDAKRSREEAASAREQLFVALVNRQSGFVFRVAFAVLRHSHDAEDVVQETFLKVYGKGQWDQIQDERAYLARVAWRVAISRRSRRADIVPMPETRSSEPTPEESATQSNWSFEVQKLIDALPEELRHPLLLSATDELKSQEIATILRIPEGTVRNRLFRARQLLKQKLMSLAETRHGR